jgi:7-cyano-7-deazaguanosine (preQ0) biosynthesis protein QueE
MQVSEIFYTIQGEGLNIGKPTIFIRLSGCHLRCSWCDTKYTWPLKSGVSMTSEELIAEVKKYNCQHLVITGGEPLIQQNALREFIEKLNVSGEKEQKYFIEMETSGSLKCFITDIIDQFNCSPKLSNSENKEIRFEPLPKEKAYYKFVVSDRQNIEEIENFIEKHDLKRENVFLMPQGVSVSELNERSQWLVEICKEKGLRFCPRLHINIWGNKRGV